MKLFTYNNKVLAVIPLVCMALGLITACGVNSAEYPFEPADPALSPIDPVALERLLERTRETRSDALVVVHDGRLVVDYRSPGIFERMSSGRIEAMSATKSVLSLAVGRLLDEGLIDSLDQAVSDFFPEWSTGDEAAVTIRHLLNHTSGLCADRTTEAIYASRDFVRHALESGLCTPPGEVSFYNNNATNLLAGVVGKAAGKPLDEYLKQTVFAELGTQNVSWTRDRAGNPHGMAGLQISALDFARIGQMMLDGGQWQGRTVISPAWVEASFDAPDTAPAGHLLWWPIRAWERRVFDEALFDDWHKAGVSESFINDLAPLTGGELEIAPLLDEMHSILGDDWRDAVADQLGARDLTLGRRDVGPVIGIEARGYLGQRLLILRDRRLVAVRQIRYRNHRKNEEDDFRDFTERVMELLSPTDLGNETPGQSNR
jgi:CubicO group peptidase (beta-lactamase class C family)